MFCPGDASGWEMYNTHNIQYVFEKVVAFTMHICK